MIQHYLLKKSQNKASQASQKPANTKVLFPIYFHCLLNVNELVAQLEECRIQNYLLNVGVGSNLIIGVFEDFFFIVGEKGWAHPKVFRLPHPSITKCLAFEKLGYRKGLK